MKAINETAIAAMNHAGVAWLSTGTCLRHENGKLILYRNGYTVDTLPHDGVLCRGLILTPVRRQNGRTMKNCEGTIEIAETMALTDAWKIAGEIGSDGRSISMVAERIVKSYALDATWSEVRDAIVDALDCRAMDDDPRSDDPNALPSDRSGVTVIGDDRVYWWSNNAVTEWTTERPDWW